MSAPRLAFPLEPEEVRRIEDVLGRMREARDPRALVEDLALLVAELTERGLDRYFLEPLRRVEAGPVARSAARLGVSAAARTLPPMVRRVLRSLDGEQLRGIADFLEERLERE